MPTRLQDLNALEVSFVEEGANEKEFLLFKSQKEQQKEQSLVQSLIKQEEEGAEGQGEAEIGDLNQELSQEAERAVVGAIRLLNDYVDQIPDEVMEPLVNLIGGMEQAMLFMDKQGANFGNLSNDLNKGGIEMPRDNGLDFEQLPEEVEKEVEALFKKHSELIQEKEEVVKELNEVKEEKRRKEFIEKAKDFDHLPIDPKDFGEILKEISDNTGCYDEIKRLLKSMNEEARQSQLFKEKGSTGASASNDAWSKIEKKAESLSEKAGSDLSKQQAITKVMENNPELYNEYIKSE